MRFATMLPFCSTNLNYGTQMVTFQAVSSWIVDKIMYFPLSVTVEQELECVQLYFFHSIFFVVVRFCSFVLSVFHYLTFVCFFSIFFFFIEFPEAGCENGCSRHGQCTLEDGEYKCVCIEGWSGPDCSIQLEMNCNDNIDNDHGKFIVLVSMYETSIFFECEQKKNK